jgi:hypothetical protein
MSVLVYFNAKIAEGKDWERGRLVGHDTRGVTLEIQGPNYTKRRVFYPAHQITRMEYE